ncbi:MAG: histidine kinase [Sulfurimonas sp. RIFCSPHIGHO2_12_FULL_36_9]|uniref:ATP-binding protein n=1 Tax=Sulfurimonas sp. RIFCSPLOWO2_12_36_12 TaxID=1802253 RepID=UPI0008D87DFD|nr:ATP-binding protein [Sulfurimonas sp. RIFCSPLOWO2_12_36_12]OHD96672.1 MAG: histidine kinase [Sulfurimonas sp. RIFCSPHIGHO2_12_FULL_36_9]OHD97976.1 MAG: histidine kinase [Sulfurimonas sp. RIFCSPLOWO2_02_FULL_36_28]OHE00191.1 MAG: histidine kinase [Sulfurimonas sp. RIFCSPLOWO2_12_36_12]OHE05076.1 MAG: histidine kinase [Sulfurimonas sp. RIFCSPLOWO2_12_FULL_36_74]
MPKELNTSEAVLIAPNIYWVGMHLKNDPFQCHPYLIKNGDESILIDPGSMIEFSETVRKVKTIIDIKSIKYIILHHQDPDLAAAVPEIEKLINRDDLQIVTHSRMSVLIKHYLVTSSYYEIDKHDNKLVTASGFKLDFLTTPYCHSPGAFVSYESSSKTLFSGDIFGGIDESWDFYADETYFDKAKQFHQEYMPSKDIFNYALGKIEKLDISLIAPQHGSIIEKKYISELIKDMKNLDCGLYIEEKYNRELIDTIDELQRKEHTIKERNLLLFEQSKRAEIGEMIGNIAHQWRQPLAIINTSLAILKEKNRADVLSKDEIDDKLEKMEKRVTYMSETIEDFMNYYSPDKQKSWFSINTAVEKALDIVNLEQNNRGVKINLLLNSEYKIYGLINEFIQVLVSILSNIDDLITTKNLADANITIALYRNDEYTTLTIADNCGGINDENLSKIFDPYFTTKHKSMGTGLGLHIAKMIIEENMNGSLSAKNIYNSNNVKLGAEFIIKIKNEN